MAKTQTLSFPIRLPDAMQAEALRLLAASRLAINEILVDQWPQLDQFAGDRSGPAWKQIEPYVLKRSGHGSAAKWSRPKESCGPKRVANRFSKAFCLCSRKA